MKPALIASAIVLVLLSACDGERPSPRQAAEAPPAAAPLDQPAEDVPPATAPSAAPHPGERALGVSDRGAPDGDRDLARFGGYGEIPFGTPAEEMERAWGGDLATLGKEHNDRCYFMTPTWAKAPAEFHFMIGDGRFARFGTESDTFAAPGGGKVGMTRAEIDRLYAGRIEERPHKYTDGAYLRIADPAGGKGVLVFETDSAGDDAKITEWRVGVPPQVDFVEGCS